MVKKIIPQDMKEGTLHYTTKGYPFEIVKYKGYAKVYIKFLNTGFETIVYSTAIRKGNVKDFLAKEVYGVGCIGVGVYTCGANSKINKVYKVWAGMLERCYSTRLHKVRPSYKGCYVQPSWLNYQNFAKWYEDFGVEDLVMDKDIICYGKGLVPHYSEDTVSFIPVGLNNILTGSDKTRSGEKIGTSIKTEKDGTFKGRYISTCGGVYLGTFLSEEIAYNAYRSEKLRQIQEYQHSEIISYKVKESLKLLIGNIDHYLSEKNK